MQRERERQRGKIGDTRDVLIAWRGTYWPNSLKEGRKREIERRKEIRNLLIKR